MVNHIIIYFEQLAAKLGLDIKIPRPGRVCRKRFSASNTLVGLILIGIGITFKKYSILLLGVLGIAGAILFSLDE